MTEHNLEKTVLNDVFWRPTFLDQANLITELSTNDFKSEDFKRLYQLFSTILMKRAKVDPVSIYEADKDAGLECNNWVCGTIPSMEEAQKHIKMLKERNYRDEVRLTTSKLTQELINENNTDKFDETKNRLIIELSKADLDTGSKFIDPVSITEKIDENMQKDVGLEGYSWGVADLDLYTSGLISPRMYVIGGLKKTGKSRFVINSRYHLYQQDATSVFMSLEMPGYEVMKLQYSRFTKIPDTHFRAIGFMSAQERDRYLKAKREINWEKLPTECVSGVNINQVLQRLRYYQKMYNKADKPLVVYIDYLQRIKHNVLQGAQELGDISNALADATRNYGISIVLLAQLSNIAEREDLNIGHLKGCVEENTLIDGVPIKDYYRKGIKKDIPSFDTENLQCEDREFSQVIDSGVKNCFEITTKSGKKIIVSDTTRLFSETAGWVFSRDLKVGDNICTKTNNN